MSHHRCLANLIAALAALLLLAGCAHGLIGTLPNVSDDAAEIVFAREERFVGGGASVPITIDGVDTYAIRIGEHVAIKVPPGDRIIGVRSIGAFLTWEERTITLHADPRQRYYFRIDPTASGAELNRMSVEAGRALVGKTKPLDVEGLAKPR